MLRDQDRRANPRRQRLRRSCASAWTPAGRGADREAADRAGAACGRRRARRACGSRGAAARRPARSGAAVRPASSAKRPREAAPAPGLASVSAAPSASAATASRRAALGRRGDDERRARPRRARGSARQRVEPVDARHVEVEQDHVDVDARRAAASACRRRWRRLATTSKSAMAPSMRASTARATRRIVDDQQTRRQRLRGVRLAGCRHGAAASARVSGDADDLQLALQRIAIERLHHIFVGAGIDRRADMGRYRSRSCRTRPSGWRRRSVSPSARRNSMPLITGMFQSSRMTSGIAASQRDQRLLAVRRLPRPRSRAFRGYGGRPCGSPSNRRRPDSVFIDASPLAGSHRTLDRNG